MCVLGVTCNQCQRHRRRYSNKRTLQQPKEQGKQNPGACSRLQRLHQTGELESEAQRLKRRLQGDDFKGGKGADDAWHVYSVYS
jgi:hypothetical protein